MTRDKTITRFSSLHELTNSVLSKSAVYVIEKTFGLGEAYVVKIAKDNKVIGDFTLLFQVGTTIAHTRLIELYANQLGLFIERNRTID